MARLELIFKTRNQRVVFVTGDPDASFADIAEVMDIAKGVGVDTIGLITNVIREGS